MVLRGFYHVIIYGRSSHLCQVTWIIHVHIGYPFSCGRFVSDLALIGQTVPEMRIFEYYGNIRVYYPRVGADQPLGSTSFSVS